MDYTHDEQTVIVEGLKYIKVEIHNCHVGKNYKEELALLHLFGGIISLDEDLHDKAKMNILTAENAELTKKAKANFEIRWKEALKGEELGIGFLCKILREYANDYYKEHVSKIIGRKLNSFHLYQIDLNDGFRMIDFSHKARDRCYKSLDNAASDLSKVIRYIADGSEVYIQKNFDNIHKCYKISYISSKNMRSQLKDIYLYSEFSDSGKEKRYNALDALLKHKDMLSITGVSFTSTDPTVFTLFHGYKYQPIESGKASRFIECVKNTISNGNEEVFEYIMNWISYLIQKPDKKAETAIIITGNQGSGKTTFTDVLSELFAGYSLPNINDIRMITGTFNAIIENKRLIILNELKNSGDERKSKITDATLTVKEKYLPPRIIENISNFIFVSNHMAPVKIERRDRRYLQIRCSDDHIKDYDYWKQLYADIKEDGFYEDLMFVLTNRNIDDFNPAKIPVAEIKRLESPYDEFISSKYDYLTTQDELRLIEIKEMFRNFNLINYQGKYKVNSLIMKLNEVCDVSRPRINGERPRIYKLKDSYKEYYKPEDID